MSTEISIPGALAEVQEFVKERFGEIRANTPLTLLASIAWDECQPAQHRIRAATALLPYCHQGIRANDLEDQTDQGLSVTVLGNVNVVNNQVVAAVAADPNSERVVAETPPG